MTREEIQQQIDALCVQRDAIPLPTDDLVVELTRAQMDGECAAYECTPNYKDAGQGWRDVTASGVRAVLDRLHELGWRAPDEARPLPEGVTLDSVAEKLGLLEAT